VVFILVLFQVGVLELFGVLFRHIPIIGLINSVPVTNILFRTALMSRIVTKLIIFEIIPVIRRSVVRCFVIRTRCIIKIRLVIIIIYVHVHIYTIL